MKEFLKILELFNYKTSLARIQKRPAFHNGGLTKTTSMKKKTLYNDNVNGNDNYYLAGTGTLREPVPERD